MWDCVFFYLIWGQGHGDLRDSIDGDITYRTSMVRYHMLTASAVLGLSSYDYRALVTDQYNRLSNT